MKRRGILLFSSILAFPAPVCAAAPETTTLYFNQYYEISRARLCCRSRNHHSLL